MNCLKVPLCDAGHNMLELLSVVGVLSFRAIGRPSAEGPRERSRGREMPPEEKPAPSMPAAAATNELSADDMEKKTKSILDEYLHIQDLKVQ